MFSIKTLTLSSSLLIKSFYKPVVTITTTTRSCIRNITTSIFNNIKYNNISSLLPSSSSSSSSTAAISSSIFSRNLISQPLFSIGKTNSTCLTSVRFMNRNARRPKKVI